MVHDSVWLRLSDSEYVGLTCENLDETKQDDDDQCQQLGGCEQVLDFGGCSHTDTVHKCQRCYKRGEIRLGKRRGLKTWKEMY